MIKLDEPIAVGVLFEKNVVRPVWFRRQGRKVEIQSVTSRWSVPQGRELVTHFGVSDGLNLYRLTLSHRTLVWRLSGVAQSDDA
jgi:hypothetical protein